jgi:hypothetical protein
MAEPIVAPVSDAKEAWSCPCCARTGEPQAECLNCGFILCASCMEDDAPWPCPQCGQYADITEFAGAGEPVRHCACCGTLAVAESQCEACNRQLCRICTLVFGSEGTCEVCAGSLAFRT